MKDLDDVQQGVLASMDRSARNMRLGIIGAVFVETALLAFALVYMDWKDKLQVELFVFSILGYTIVVLGLAALAAHMSRLTGRVIQALHEIRRDPG